MLCLLCLKQSTSANVVDIFENDLELNVANVLKQHFWFEPELTDDISTKVCYPCWLTVSGFHEFYINVKMAHRLLTQGVLYENMKQEADTTSTLTPLEEITLKTISPLHNEHNVPTHQLPYTTLKLEIDEDEDYIYDEEHLTHEDAEYAVADEEECVAYDCIEIRSASPATALSKSPTKQLPKKRHKQTTNSHAIQEPLIDVNAASAIECKARLSDEDLDENILKHMKIICDICAIEFKRFNELGEHMSATHNCRGYAVCCSRKFYKRSQLSDHIEEHLNPDMWKCEECDKVFATKHSLRSHELVKHQPDELKPFQCSECPKKFAKSYLLEQHRILHPKARHPCSLCTKTFSTLNSLRTHIKVIHENYGHMCDICAKVIRGKALFEQHQLQHKGVVLPKIQCDKCGTWHKDKYTLQRHKRRHAEESMTHTCNICGKVSPSRTAMLSHQRYVHAAHRKFECNVCGKSFKKPIELREHMTTHTGEVLYTCQYCPKTFNSNANMHSHRKKAHPKEFAEVRRKRQENATTPTIPTAD